MSGFKTAVVIFSLVATSAVASQQKSPVKIREFVQSRLRGTLKILNLAPPMVPPPIVALPEVPSVLPRSYSDAEATSCIQSICGSAKANWADTDVFSPRKIESVNFKNFWEQNLEPKIRQASAIEQENAKFVAERLPQIIDQGFQGESLNSIRSLVGLLRVSAKVSDLLSVVLKLSDDNKVMTIDEAKLQNALKKQPVNQRSAMEIVLRQVFDSTISGDRRSDPFVSALSFRLQQLYSGVKVSVALKNDAAQALARVAALEAALGPVIAREFVPQNKLDLLQRTADGAEILVSAADSETYSSVVSALDVLSLAVDPGASFKFIEAAGDLNEILREAKDDGTVETIAAMGQSNPSEIVKATVGECRKILAVTSAMDMSDLQKRKLAESLAAMKVAAKSVVKKMLPGSSTGIDAINGIRFEVPPRGIESVNTISSVVTSRLLTAQLAQKSYQAKSAEADKLVLLKAVISEISANASDDSLETLKACRELPVRAISDATLSSKGKISVSWYSVVYPEVGLPILSHELGHAVSYALRRAADQLPKENAERSKFEQNLGCVVNRNPFVVSPMTPNPMDNTLWSEEDWADHFSALVMNELRTKGDQFEPFTKNIGCALVNDYGDIYRDNELAPKMGDKHSSGLLRMLLYANDRGNMTPQCQPFVEFAKKSGRNLLCE